MQQDYEIIHSVMPGAAVVMGGLAYDNFTESGGPFVRRFLADFLAVGGGQFTDAINFHHYSGTAWPNLAAVVTSLRDTVSAAGIQRPLIWTESGAPSSQRYGGSPSMQANYVVKSYAAAFGLESQPDDLVPLPGLRQPDLFLLRQPRPAGARRRDQAVLCGLLGGRELSDGRHAVARAGQQ